MHFSLRQLLMGVALIAVFFSLMSLATSVTSYVQSGQTYNRVEFLAFSPDGTRLAVILFGARDAGIPYKGYLADVSHTIVLVEVASLSTSAVVQYEFLNGNQGPLLRGAPCSLVAFSPDAKYLKVLPWRGGRLRRWDIAASSWSKNRLDDESQLSAFAISANAQWIATWAPLKGAAIWDAGSGKKVIPTSNLGWPFAFSPDSKNVAFATSTDVQVWDLEAERLVRKFHGNHDVLDRVTCLAISPDGDTLGMRCNEGLRLFSISTGEENVVLPEDFEIIRTSTGYGTRSSGDQTRGIAFSPDGKLLAAWGTYGLKFFDMTQGCKLPRSVADRSIFHFAFSPDGKTCATGHRNGKVALWDVATGKEIRSAILRGNARIP